MRISHKDTKNTKFILMNIEEVRDYCLSKKGATEDFPFDEVSLVIKVGASLVERLQ